MATQKSVLTFLKIIQYLEKSQLQILRFFFKFEGQKIFLRLINSYWQLESKLQLHYTFKQKLHFSWKCHFVMHKICHLLWSKTHLRLCLTLSLVLLTFQASNAFLLTKGFINFFLTGWVKAIFAANLRRIYRTKAFGNATRGLFDKTYK